MDGIAAHRCNPLCRRDATLKRLELTTTLIGVRSLRVFKSLISMLPIKGNILVRIFCITFSRCDADHFLLSACQVLDEE